MTGRGGGERTWWEGAGGRERPVRCAEAALHLALFINKINRHDVGVQEKERELLQAPILEWCTA